jgi:uncharacterized membrane-anchored protein
LFRLRWLALFGVVLSGLFLARPIHAAPGKGGGSAAAGGRAQPSAAPAASDSIDDPASSTDETDDGPPLPWKDGPQKIDLGHGAAIDLPVHRRFLGLPEASQLMEKMGNLYNDNLLGIVVSDNDDDYLVVLRYDEEGFIKDDDKLDSKEILESIRSGEAEYNEQRKKRGFPPIHAEGWFEEPRYDKAEHKLTWALHVTASDGSSVNLSTRVLGRRGYVSVTLLADPEKFAVFRDDGTALVAATTFGPGSRYGDFDNSKDKVAEYGLTGLIVAGVGVGVAKAAKVGLLAAFWKPILAFVLAAKKAVIAGVIAIGAFIRKIFGGKREKSAAREG